MDLARAGHKVDRDGGERLHFSGADFVIRASAETTGGAFSITEEIDPLDTPLHVHEHEDELFYVLEGEHIFEVGDEQLEVGPGGLAFGPRGIPHSQRRVVPRRGRTLTMVSPAGFGRLLPRALEGRGRWHDRARRLRAGFVEIRHHLALSARRPWILHGMHGESPNLTSAVAP
jgi:mannose-6-phosphate isomerase-like protein (cupin superfamily)